jgi:hypothetical protein
MSKLGTSDNIYQLHLDLGADGELKPLTYGEAKRIVALAKRRGGVKAFLPNRCFDNASKLLLSDREQTLKYHEGFAATEGSEHLVEHAWVSINGKVVDLTFRAAIKNEVLTPHDYLGIEIPRTMHILCVIERWRYPAVMNSDLLFKFFGRTLHSKYKAEHANV